MSAVKELLDTFDITRRVTRLDELSELYKAGLKRSYDARTKVQEAQAEVNRAEEALYVAPLTGGNDQARKGEIAARREQSQRCIDAAEALAAAKKEESDINAELEAMRVETKNTETIASFFDSFAKLFGGRLDS